jgi:hypothetical protein
MPLSGLVSAGVRESLEELFQRELLKEKQEQLLAQQAWERANRAGEQRESRRQFDVTQAGREADRATEARRLEATLTRQDTQDRRTANQEGVRRMLGEFVTQQGAPETPEGRATLQGMAMQEGINLPEMLTKPSLKEVAAADTAKRGQERDEWKWRQDYDESQIRNRPAKAPRENLTPGQAFSATRALRNDFVRETQAAREVQRQFMQMQSAIAAAQKGDMAAGSQGVLVTFQKILDPTSVVRESEYARSGAGQALLARMQGAVDQLVKGGAGVPVPELKKFVSLAEQFAKNQADAAAETKAQIDAIAEEYGINPANITREYGGAKPSGGGFDPAKPFTPK